MTEQQFTNEELRIYADILEPEEPAQCTALVDGTHYYFDKQSVEQFVDAEGLARERVPLSALTSAESAQSLKRTVCYSTSRHKLSGCELPNMAYDDKPQYRRSPLFVAASHTDLVAYDAYRWVKRYLKRHPDGEQGPHWSEAQRRAYRNIMDDKRKAADASEKLTENQEPPR